jgi:hypothetical protein
VSFKKEQSSMEPAVLDESVLGDKHPMQASQVPVSDTPASATNNTQL